MANSNVKTHTPAAQKTIWAWTLGTFFGAGLLKPGPGTFGSCAAVVLWYGTAHALQPSSVSLTIGTAVAAIIAMIIGIPAATIVAQESGHEDPGLIVIDEVAGQLFALIGFSAKWQYSLVALLLFRLLDILKPPPIRRLERLPAGLGIMLDDVAAGLFACAGAHIILYAIASFR